VAGLKRAIEAPRPVEIPLAEDAEEGEDAEGAEQLPLDTGEPEK
jgi:hypothetical protein